LLASVRATREGERTPKWAELPVSHTQLPEEKLRYDFEAYWFRLAVGGVPPDFRGRRDLSL
jgi:hypothetical protein